MHAKFGIVSFRTESLALSGAEWVEKSLSISSCGTRLQFLGISATRCSENSDPAIAGHFSRHDRATQHGNISHLVANEVEAFAGERGGSLAVPRKPSFWRSPGRLLILSLRERGGLGPPGELQLEYLHCFAV